VPRLRRSEPRGPGIQRVRSGKGYAYRAPDGKPVDAATRDRIAGLVIPPAWTEVWICPFPNGHIQATGRDAAGRTQYLYHEVWRLQKDRVKFDRALELAASLPAARRRVTRDLRGDDPRLRTLAAAFRMLDAGALRVGSERYVELHGSHGLSTLLCSHVVVSGTTVRLGFPGKSGQEWMSELDDADLAAALRPLKRRGPTARMLAYKTVSSEGRAVWHPISAEDINDYVRERTGGDFTAKDFRTLTGTVAAACSLARSGPQPTKTARARAVREAVKVTSELLGNTLAVARSSYIDPRVLDAYDDGRTLDRDRLDSAESQLRLLLVD
jgi:DNA topoisomerase-1